MNTNYEFKTKTKEIDIFRDDIDDDDVNDSFNIIPSTVFVFGVEDFFL